MLHLTVRQSSTDFSRASCSAHTRGCPTPGHCGYAWTCQQKTKQQLYHSGIIATWRLRRISLLSSSQCNESNWLKIKVAFRLWPHNQTGDPTVDTHNCCVGVLHGWAIHSKRNFFFDPFIAIEIQQTRLHILPARGSLCSSACLALYFLEYNIIKLFRQDFFFKPGLEHLTQQLEVWTKKPTQFNAN